MPLIPTPFDNRITRLKERIDRPGKQQGLKKRLGRLEGRQYWAQQTRRPETPLPYSGEYETTMGKLGRDRDQSLADLSGRRLATEQQFGFGADTSNPFSQARLLERQWQQQTNRTTNSYAAAGQLYSGALSNQRNADSFAGFHALDTAQREYQSRLGDISSQELGANRSYDEGQAAAEAKRLEEALAERPDPSEAPPRPGEAKKHLAQLKKRAKTLDHKGRDRRADKLRERLARLKETPLG